MICGHYHGEMVPTKTGYVCWEAMHGNCKNGRVYHDPKEAKREINAQTEPKRRRHKPIPSQGQLFDTEGSEYD